MRQDYLAIFPLVIPGVELLPSDGGVKIKLLTRSNSESSGGNVKRNLLSQQRFVSEQ